MLADPVLDWYQREYKDVLFISGRVNKYASLCTPFFFSLSIIEVLLLSASKSRQTSRRRGGEKGEKLFLLDLPIGVELEKCE